MADIVFFFGPLELVALTLFLGGAIAVATAGLLRRRERKRIKRLLDGFPYPAMIYRKNRMVEHNGGGEAWRGNLELRSLVQESARLGENIVRNIPAVEGQTFQARAIHLGDRATVLLLEDMGASQRQKAFYRNFIQNVSHELKTPLTVIQGHAAKMADTPSDTAGWAASLRIITEEAKRLTQLVDNLLTLARLESPSFSLDRTLVSMGALLEEAVLQLSDIADERKVSLDLHLAPGLTRLQADRARLKQVVLNLLDNALKYTPAGGEIKVRLENDRKAKRLICVVEDTGEGIPAEDLPHIFDKLYRVRRVHGIPVEGSGLGLTLAREIIRAHGGEIHAESRVGVGSKFTFTLPLEPNGASGEA